MSRDFKGAKSPETEETSYFPDSSTVTGGAYEGEEDEKRGEGRKRRGRDLLTAGLYFDQEQHQSGHVVKNSVLRTGQNAGEVPESLEQKGGSA